MDYMLLCVTAASLGFRGIHGECLGPQLKLLSDDPRRTCTEIFASKDRIEYVCTSLIKGFPKTMIKYCPVELCMTNGTWSKPSISCALSECYEEGKSREYMGHRMCSSSGRQCQRWDTQEPQRHRFRKSEMFPDYSIQLADAFCRDPEGVKGFPWCFTTDPNKKWETCNIQKCSEMIVLDGSCGQLPLEPDTEQDSEMTSDKKDSSEKSDSRQKDDKEATEENDSLGDLAGGDREDEEKENKKNKSNNKDQPKEEGDDGVDSLPICSTGYDLFQVQKDYRIRGKVINERQVRSVVQCATLCSQMRLCRAMSFRHLTKDCILHGGKDFTMIETKGYKAGAKACDL